MNYEKVSDFEINKLIAVELAQNGYIGINKSQRSDSEVVVTTENGEGCAKNSYVDYCNNPSDAWPIIVENGVSINHGGMLVGGKWIDYWYCGDGKGNCCNGDSPLRAAMIVYLMMKDEE